MKKQYFITFLLAFSFAGVFAQTAYHSVQDEALYLFLDDMATQHIIDISTTVKPYSRQHIASWLAEANNQQHKLSKAQQERLGIYMKEFALELNKPKQGNLILSKKDTTFSIHLIPPEMAWRDSLSRIMLRPIYGIRFFRSTNNNFFHSYGGLEATAYVGKNWAFNASIRDNYQQHEILAFPIYLTNEMGGNYKVGVQGRSGGDYSEMRGSISYSWDWGHIGFVKDRMQWGTNYNGANIFSGRTPSFSMIKLHLSPVDWFEFDYFHGWLVSEVTDSLRSVYMPDGAYRKVFYEKYIAANMFTFKPFKRLHLSIGNSIIYDQANPHPAYFFPFNFFKSIPHTYKRGVTTNDNSMMFFNISSRQIKYMHLYYGLYVDELSITRIGDPDRHNFLSHKGGFAISGWPLKNLSFAYEMTFTKPMTYQHRVPTTTFETNQFNLGHYLRDNSRDVYASIRYLPYKAIQISASYLLAEKGNLYIYQHGSEVPADRNPVLKDIVWRNQSLILKGEWFPLANLRIFAEFQISDLVGFDVDGKKAEDYLDMFSPQYLHGKTNTLVMGFGYGFN